MNIQQGTRNVQYPNRLAVHILAEGLGGLHFVADVSKTSFELGKHDR
jgi:hypothetical protein